MTRRHLKRLSAPKSWPISRKTTKWITRPLPGAHSIEEGYSIDTFLKEILGIVNTTKEIKYLLTKKNVFVNWKRVFDKRYCVGLFDTIALGDVKAYYRITYDAKGKLTYIKVTEEDSKHKLAKIIGKTVVKKGKIQLNLGDGRNILVDAKDGSKYNTGNVLLVELPDGKINDILLFESGSLVILTGGKHRGNFGKILEVKGENVIVQTQSKENFSTPRKYAFLIGKDKPRIMLKKEQDEKGQSEQKDKN
ncbi:30S ribosomal protein S4e [Candidatus Woesearchaeota archaeon]|nr:30S ribosomal protein S4e [Candidatus Woesearchaeota archaeon]